MGTFNCKWIWLLVFTTSLVESQTQSERAGDDKLPRRNLIRADSVNAWPMLGKLNCQWSDSMQLTNTGGFSLREVNYGASQILSNLLQLLELAEKETVEIFKQTLYPDRTFLRTPDLTKALTLGHPPQLDSIHDDFQNEIKEGLYLIHEYTRVRSKREDGVFIYCLRGDMEIVGAHCTENIKATCVSNSWTLPIDPDLKEDEVIVEVLVENSLNRLSWMSLLAEPSEKEFITEAYPPVMMGSQLKSMLMTQINIMLSQLNTFSMATSVGENSCNPWLRSAFNILKRSESGELTPEAEKTVVSKCQVLTGDLLKLSDDRKHRSLFSMLFEDNSAAIHQLVRGQHRSVKSENILHHNQVALHSGLSHLSANLMSFKNNSEANYVILQKALRTIQARQSLGDLETGHKSTRLALHTYLSSLHGQAVTVRSNWDEMINNLMKEMENFSTCNLKPESSRIACKKERGFITRVEDGVITVKSRSVIMTLKEISLVQCLAIWKGSEYRVFRGNGHGFIKNGQVFFHQNFTVPVSCVFGQNDMKIDCDKYLVSLGESEYAPLTKGENLMYLPILGENPGVYLQSKVQSNVVSHRTSTILHHVPMFYRDTDFPLHIGDSQFSYDDFSLDHESYSQKFYLEVHEPQYFDIEHKINSWTPDNFIQETWGQEFIAQIAMKYRNQDPIFITISSLSGLMFTVLFGLVIYCCCCRRCTLRQIFCCCCDKKAEGRSKMDLNYYREHAARYLPIYRGRANKASKDETKSQEPFLNVSAPEPYLDNPQIIVRSSERQPAYNAGPKPSKIIAGPTKEQMEAHLISEGREDIVQILREREQRNTPNQ